MRTLSKDELAFFSGGEDSSGQVAVVTVTATSAQVSEAKAEYAAGVLAGFGGVAAGALTTGACLLGAAWVAGPVGIAGAKTACGIAGGIVGSATAKYLSDYGGLFQVQKY